MVQYRQALTNIQRFFTQRTQAPTSTDEVNRLPGLTIPVDDAITDVRPGVHVTGMLPAAANKLTWPPVPQDERHEYDNISFGRTNSSGTADIALAVQGRQAGTSWSRVYARWANVGNNVRVNLLAASQSASELFFTTPGPLVLYPGEELVIRNITQNETLNTIWRIDWIRRIRAPGFTFVVQNDVPVLT